MKKKIIGLIAVALSTVLLATACTTGTTEVKTIYAATGGMPKPFIITDDAGNLSGHNIEFVQEIFKRLPQYKLEIQTTEFASIFAGLDSDRYQLGVNNFAMNDERKEKYDFSEPIFQNRYVVVVPKSGSLSGTINSLEDLAGKKTVTSAGNNIATTLENYNKANPDKQIIIEYTKADLLVQIQDIEAGKYDFALHDKPIFDEYVKEYDLKINGLPLSDELSAHVMQRPYSYILVAKGNDQLLKDINEKIREIISDGTSKKINEKYLGEDFSPKLS